MTSSMNLISHFVALVVVALVLQGAEAKPPRRIVGGGYAKAGEIPYQISLRQNDRHVCGGTIIGKRHIMTAGHCIDGVSTNPSEDMIVVSGTILSKPGAGNTNHIKSATIHPKFSNKREDSWRNDIAIIALEEDIKFDEFTKIAKLASKDTEPELECITSGWGDMFYPWGVIPAELKKMTTFTVDNEECRKLYPKTPILESQICTLASKGVGICQGDSGGPLVIDGEVHGITSWNDPCGSGIPDVFTRVYYFLDFIKETMAST